MKRWIGLGLLCAWGATTACGDDNGTSDVADTGETADEAGDVVLDDAPGDLPADVPVDVPVDVSEDDGGGDSVADDGGPAPVVVQVAAGGTHTCARYDDGAVYCWGDDEVLAGGGTTGATPVRIAGLDAVQLTCGGQFACALPRGGGASCWGQIQFGTTLAAPTAIAGFPAGAALTEIDGGQNHACARGATGPVYCWGANHHGHLGDTTSTSSDSAVVVNGVTDAVSVGLGQQHSCAAAGVRAHCWGWSHAGQVGVTTETNLTPFTLPLFGDAGPNEVDGGDAHTCARVGSMVACWGLDSGGRMGNGVGAGALQLTPAFVTGLTGVAQIGAGGDVTCARMTDGTVRCWGVNSWGSAGGTADPVPTPTAVAGLPSAAIDLSVGPEHTCVVLDDHSVWCWGSNWNGMLGDPTLPIDIGSTSRTPVRVVGLP